MKIYSHDYTKPSEVEKLLNSATLLMSNECYYAAVERINEARQLLQEYLAKDNMIIDRDATGYVKDVDTFDEEQLCFIRDEFACIMERSNNANGELEIINKCCGLLEDPVFESFDEWKKDTSGTWSEKEINVNE